MASESSSTCCASRGRGRPSRGSRCARRGFLRRGGRSASGRRKGDADAVARVLVGVGGPMPRLVRAERRVAAERSSARSMYLWYGSTTCARSETRRRPSSELPVGVSTRGVVQRRRQRRRVDRGRSSTRCKTSAPRRLARTAASSSPTGAHVVLPYHKYMDRALEALRGDASLGTTSRASAPPTPTSTRRDGVRVADFLRPDALRPALLRNLASRNEILSKAGLDPLDAQQCSTIRSPSASASRPTSRTVTYSTTHGARAAASSARAPSLRPRRRPRHLPLRHLEQHGAPNGVPSGTGLPRRPVSEVLGIAKPTAPASAPDPSRRTTLARWRAHGREGPRGRPPRRAASASAAGSTPSSRAPPCARKGVRLRRADEARRPLGPRAS